MIVEDLARDGRFHDHPLVQAKGARFYAGAILRSDTGHALGTLCIGDVRPRIFSANETHKLLELTRGVSAVLDLHRQSRLLFRAATEDSLTGLCNRRLFDERLQNAVARARPDDPCRVLCLDLDGFKQVNDTFGHAGGDALLREVGHRLSAVVRANDTVARLGGDEFAILLQDPAAIDGAERLAQRILDAFAQTYEFEGVAIPIRTSIGIATCYHATTDAAEVMRSADAALYQAKQSGRGRSKVHAPVEIALLRP